MFGRRNIAVLLLVGVSAFSAVGCQEGLPTGPTGPITVQLSSAPATLTAEPSTGVTLLVAGVPVALDWKASFAVVINLDLDSDPVAITSLNNAVRQAVAGVVVVPTPPDAERYLFDQRVRGNRVEPGGEQVIEFDVWYTLPRGGPEAVVTTNITFTPDTGAAFVKTLDIPVAP
ncbi:MAG: hypothetical protein O3A25_09430 [Acidobacteria bacterium]|nr:hypothetical protein [Acidobacteriota bacterium]